MSEKIEIKLQPLWLISYKNNYSEHTEIASQRTLNYYNAHHEDAEIKILEKIKINLPNIEVFCTNVSSSNCYVRKDYEVHSDVELKPLDFDILRALNTFMGGQREGDMVSCKNLGDKFVYHLVSQCDSSD